LGALINYEVKRKGTIFFQCHNSRSNDCKRNESQL